MTTQELGHAVSIDPSAVDLIGKAATAAGLPPQTLWSAVERGDIDSITLGCGSVVVYLSDVHHFAANRPKRGPKRGPKPKTMG